MSTIEPLVKEALPTITSETSGRTEHIWALPLEQDFLETFLRDMFENHYDKLTFGPLIPGAAYELKTPGKPQSVTMMDGYMTIHWGAKGHFHLCIGPTYGPKSNPNPPEIIVQRRPSRAELYRGLGKDGDPTTWGFRMFNGDGQPQITIFMPNPFIGDDDRLTDVHDFSRVDLWDYVKHRYAGHPPEEFDRLGKGFRQS